MSYIRALEHPEWEEGIGTGFYVYSDRKGLCYMPSEHRAFVEVVMRMLDQSGELDDETLTDVHAALRSRLRVEDGTVGKHRDTQPAYGGSEDDP